VYGVFDVISLVNSKYVVLIDKATKIGTLLHSNVYRVDNLLFIPLNENLAITSDDRSLIKMYKKVADQKSFYFSPEMDLSRSVQSMMTDSEKLKEPVVNTCMKEFIFNSSLIDDTTQNKDLMKFYVPCIYGYVFISSLFK
jgi:hypothetical protein